MPSSSFSSKVGHAALSDLPWSRWWAAAILMLSVTWLVRAGFAAAAQCQAGAFGFDALGIHMAIAYALSVAAASLLLPPTGSNRRMTVSFIAISLLAVALVEVNVQALGGYTMVRCVS